jgi:tetratricopeptide (TPR) repeat protein
VALTNLGLVERDAGRPESAAGAIHEAIAIWERTGDRQRAAVGIHNAALLALDLGDYDEAARGLDHAHEVARELGDRTEMAYAMADRVRVDVERGDLDAAAVALGQCCRAGAGTGCGGLGLGAPASSPRRAARTARVRLWAATAGVSGREHASGPAPARCADIDVRTTSTRHGSRAPGGRPR